MNGATSELADGSEQSATIKHNWEYTGDVIQ